MQAGAPTFEAHSQTVASITPKRVADNSQHQLIERASWVSVARGDSLWSLAREYNTTVANLCALNHINQDTTLRVGLRLKTKVWYERVPVSTPTSLNAQPATHRNAG